MVVLWAVFDGVNVQNATPPMLVLYDRLTPSTIGPMDIAAMAGFAPLMNTLLSEILISRLLVERAS